MRSLLQRLLNGLFGRRASVVTRTRRDIAALLKQLREGQVRRLKDEELIALVEELSHDPQYGSALRGNTRFLASVAARYAKRGAITIKQRYAVYNILERAFPHNLGNAVRPTLGRR